MGSNVIVTIIVIVYLLFMLWIGWYSSTKISTNTDFMVAGRVWDRFSWPVPWQPRKSAAAAPWAWYRTVCQASDSARPGT